MSYRIYELTCKHCHKHYDNLYISFGHPKESFVWQWMCENCLKVNQKNIPSYNFDYDASQNWNCFLRINTKPIEEIMNEIRCGHKYDDLYENVKNKLKEKHYEF